MRNNNPLTSCFFDQALIGEKLELKERVRISWSTEGIIEAITFDDEPAEEDYYEPKTVGTPAFVNAHIHTADAFFKDKATGMNLEKAVGPEGFKLRLLNNASFEEIKKAITLSQEEGLINGCHSLADFREGGIEGLEIYRKVFAEKEAEKSRTSRTSKKINHFLYGRPPEKDQMEETLEKAVQLADGLGIPDLLFREIEVLEEWSTFFKKKNKPVLIHAAEGEILGQQSFDTFGKREIEVIIERIKPDTIIHGTKLTSEEVSLLAEKNIATVLCPRSNARFMIGFPPVEELLEEVTCALGTDNVFAVNNNLFEEMRYLYYRSLEKKVMIDPKNLLLMATVNGGEAIKQPVGQLSVGYKVNMLGV
ncbi:MAG: amidohydrolase family protein, partial [Candidatus Heimdallarchaeota archaeon]|nr:amidohydrolase family protein [Candidatus Heimdallarchaeota archaeon]MCK5048430.1 amidohydrolase family protein [Candidatus Heimdallarchaeota archaeon]